VIFEFVEDAGDNGEFRRECRKLVDNVVVRSFLHDVAVASDN